MSRAWLGLGANLDDRAATIVEAVRRLGATPGIRVVGRSDLYETPPWGVVDQPAFLNAAVEIETELAPAQLLAACIGVERALGRRRDRRWGPRLIDIDILHVEGVAMTSGELSLPHRHLTERAFALAPLAEIAPDLVVGDRPVSAWLAALDQRGIRRLDHGETR